MSTKSINCVCPPPPPGESVNFELLICTVCPHFGPFSRGGVKPKFCGHEFDGHPDFSDVDRASWHHPRLNFQVCMCVCVCVCVCVRTRVSVRPTLEIWSSWVLWAISIRHQMKQSLCNFELQMSLARITSCDAHSACSRLCVETPHRK